MRELGEVLERWKRAGEKSGEKNHAIDMSASSPAHMQG